MNKIINPLSVLQKSITDLIFIQIVRWLVALGVILRFVLNKEEYHGSILYFIVFMVVIFISYCAISTYIFVSRPSLRSNHKYVVTQIIFDIVSFFILYLLTLRTESDFFLFFFLPLLVATIYLDRIQTLVLLGGVTVALFLDIFIISAVTGVSTYGIISATLRVFLPRWVFFIFVVFFILYRKMLISKQADELILLHKISINVLAGESLQNCLDKIVEEAVNLFHAKGGKLYLRVPGRNKLRLEAQKGIDPNIFKVGDTISIDEGIAGHIFRNKLPYYIESYYPRSLYLIPRLKSLFGAVLEVPLIPPNQNIEEKNLMGILAVFNDETNRSFNNREDVAVLQRLAQFAALVIKQAQVIESEKTLRIVSNALNSNLELESVAHEILRQLREVVAYDSASIQQLEDSKLRIVACEGFSNPEKVLGIVFEIKPKYPNYPVIINGKIHALPDVVKQYPHFRREARKFQSGHIRSWIGIPLRVGDKVIGMISIDRTEFVPFTDDEAQLSQVFANQAAISLQNAQLYRRSEKNSETLALVHDIVAQMISAKDVNEVLCDVVKGAIRLSGVSAGVIYIVQKSKDEHYIQNFYQYPENFISSQPNLNDKDDVTRQIMDRRFTSRRLAINPKNDLTLYQAGFRSIIVYPIFYQGRIMGVLYLYDNKLENPSDEVEKPLSILVGQAAIAIHNARQIEIEKDQILELTQTKQDLETVLGHLEDHRNLAMIGLVYGEDIHYAKNKLGMAKKKMSNIIDGSYGTDLLSIKNYAREALNNINDYLAVLSNTQSKIIQTPEFSLFDIRLLLESVIESKRISSKISIIRNYKIPNSIMVGPERHLRQIFFVVIDNALKAMSGGIGMLTLDLQDIVDKPQGFVEIAISDSGKGIPKVQEPYLFQIGSPNNKSHQQGDGLGLVWARSFLRLYGGSIAYKSEKGKGTTFYIVLPRNFNIGKDLLDGIDT